MKNSNLKDTITTICGILILASGTILTLTQSGIILPTWLHSVGIAVGVIAGSVLAYFTGKNPNGTTKTDEQISAQQKPTETIAKVVEATKA